MLITNNYIGFNNRLKSINKLTSFDILFTFLHSSKISVARYSF